MPLGSLSRRATWSGDGILSRSASSSVIVTRNYAGGFDEVFASEGTRVIRTPIKAPRANAFAERFVGTLRRECLDRILIFGRRHLDVVLRAYVTHYDGHRPHRSLDMSPPAPQSPPVTAGAAPSSVIRRDVLGGLIHEYERAA
jgi:putative transposase